jgi:uncharacterized protein
MPKKPPAGSGGIFSTNLCGMTNSSFLKLFYGLCLLSGTFAVAQDALLPAQTARLGGYVGQQLDRAYQQQMLAKDIGHLVAPFKSRNEVRWWQTEFWGKWFTGAVLAYQYQPTPQLRAKLDSASALLIATQTPDGYIGNYAEPSRHAYWDIWGRKYVMLGLLAHYDLTADGRSLAAARRVADHLIRELAEKNHRIAQMGNHRGMAATSVLEPIALLYTRTKEPTYLAFAEEIVRQWEQPDGPQLLSKALADVAVSKRFPKPKNWWSYEQGMKAYEMMSCYEGLLELHRLTGKPPYRQAVERVWENIRQTELNVVGSGSSVECWFGGKALQTVNVKHYQETCVTATWVKLSQQLFRLTGEAKYADAIEQAYYNALLGALKPDGTTWTKYSPLAGLRQQGEEQCGMGMNCCEASGPRGLFTLPRTAVMQTGNGLSINFSNAGTYRLKTPNGQLTEVVQESDYPASGRVIVRLNVPKPETMTLRVRIPDWSKQTTLIVNDVPVENLKPGTFAEVRRDWKSGDQLTLMLDMRGRVVRLGEQPQFAALLRGPLVLARDSRTGTLAIDEVQTPVADKDGYVVLEPTTAPVGVWQAFTTNMVIGTYREGAHGKPVPVTFCDYASAGNAWDGQNRLRVWLEQLYDPEK